MRWKLTLSLKYEEPDVRRSIKAVIPQTPEATLFETVEKSFDGSTDLLCLCHLRWDVACQRPHHLMRRCARQRRTFFIEEPVFTDESIPRLDCRIDENGVRVVVPRVPAVLNQNL